MEAIGVFNSCVTALMKLSCCSLRRISRTRKMVFKVTPAMMKPKKMNAENDHPHFPPANQPGDVESQREGNRTGSEDDEERDSPVAGGDRHKTAR